MCGIAGIINPKHSPEENRSVLSGMLQIQHHRGPDHTGMWDEGPVHLGHNRLSIIDLSDAAHQPMHYRRLTLIFNGEIYNYLELKKELEAKGHHFATHSDSEVLLNAYAEWGAECVTRFVGMWAFVIWDSEKKELFASRDRFGIKPFYYIHSNGSFFFASEMKTLKTVPAFRNDINVNQVARGLQMGWLGYHDETYFTEIKALPAAHNLIYSDKGLSVQRYWDISAGSKSDLSFTDKCDAFREAFSQSISIHLRSDVPVASCLSGGLDSSAIVSMVQHLNPEMRYKSFSIYYEGKGDVDERPFISEVIRKYPNIETVYFSPTDNQIAESFHHALHHADVPVTGSSFISQYFLMKLIADNGIKVVLDGQGADEYLGGYMHSYYRLIGGMIQQGKFGKALSLTKAVNHRLGSSVVKSAAHLGKSMLAALRDEQQLYSLEFRNYYPFMTNSTGTPFHLQDVSGSRLDQFLYHLLFSTSLPSLLHYEDRNSMAFSIESRVPFLDHRLVEMAFGLSDDDRIHGTETKYVLRESLKGILPDAIYSRKDKKGFVTPGENKWLRGPLKYLLDSDTAFPEFIDKTKANSILDDYRKGDNSKATLVWRLVVLRKWMSSEF